MIKYRYPDARLIIFSKAPTPGYCKTRLIPALGQQGAARLQQELIELCVTRLCQSALCPIELWCSPDTKHSYFQSLADNFPLSLYQQQGDDLGERMFHAMSSSVSHTTIIIGTDCPLMTGAYIEEAIKKLHCGNDAVIGPAEDGGYVLLGLRQVQKSLFEEIKWGTEQVFSVTTQKLTAAGLVWQALDTLWDVDDNRDLQRYRRLTLRQAELTK